MKQAHSLFNQVITSAGAPILRWLWYLFMPSFPVWRRVFGLKVYFDSRDHSFAWFMDRRVFEGRENYREYLETWHKGTFWDLGCSAGTYALHAAAIGWRVVALDISPKAIRLVMKSAKANGLNLTAIPRAVTVQRRTYRAPTNATASNTVDSNRRGDVLQSFSWKDLVEMCGVPNVIKMDIEGGETEFLNDWEFRQWVEDNRITWLVETHGTESEAVLRKHYPGAKQLSDYNWAISSVLECGVKPHNRSAATSPAVG